MSEYGATIILYENNNIDAANSYTKQIANDNNYLFIPLYGNDDLLDGYSGIIKEIYTDFNGVLQLYFPVGSGSLLLANARLSKSMRLDNKVIGVEPMVYQRLNGIKENSIPSMSIADSLSINKIPEINMALLKYIDSIEIVEEQEIINAMAILYKHFNLITEPGGAIVLAAALKTDKDDIKKIAVLTGKNVSLEKFEEILYT